MFLSRLPWVLALCALLSVSGGIVPPVGAADDDTDYDEVVVQVGKMLEKYHFSRKKIDDALSREFFDIYLDNLDFQHLFLTQEEVLSLRGKYGERLDSVVRYGDIEPIFAIFEFFRDRLRARIAKIEEVLPKLELDFTSEETVYLTRKDEPWPANAQEADVLWRKRLQGQLLQEVLAHERDLEAQKEKAQEKSSEAKSSAERDPFPDGKEAEGEGEDWDPREKILQRYRNQLQRIEEYDHEEMVNSFLSALAQTFDPHSEYFSYSEKENFDISMKNSLVGIGALLSTPEEYATIQGLVINGPAQKAQALEVGDRILEVAQGEEGEFIDVVGMPLQKVVDLIRGKKGTVVRLKILPANADFSQTKIVSIVRDMVELKDRLAHAELIEWLDEKGQKRRLGWIYLYSFYADLEDHKTGSTKDVSLLLDRLMAEGIQGLVLDLRGNGGGSLEEAINLTGLFIPSGPVVKVKDSFENTRTWKSRNQYPVYDGPLLVMTDRASASASEILAAALQDYQRAVVVGEKSTFGKGTVQTIAPVGREMSWLSKKERAGALKVTIQKFYRIAGGSTQLKGVEPDIVLPSPRDPMDIGEAALTNPLDYSEIDKEEYTLFRVLPLEKLREKSIHRLTEDRDFDYVREDIARFAAEIENNRLSLNKEQRLAEMEEEKARNKQRLAERRERYASLEEQWDALQVYRLTLDDVKAKKLPLKNPKDDEQATGMILADEEEEGEDRFFFPKGLTPVKREALSILSDLVSWEQQVQTAKADAS